MDATTRREARRQLADLCRLVDQQSRTTARPPDEAGLMRLVERYLGISQGEPLTGRRWTWCPDQRMLELEPRLGVYLVANGLERNGQTSGVMGRAAIMGATTCLQLPDMSGPAILVQVLAATSYWADSYASLYGVTAPLVEDKTRPVHRCRTCFDTGILHDTLRSRDILCPDCPPEPTWQPDGTDNLRPVAAVYRGRSGRIHDVGHSQGGDE